MARFVSIITIFSLVFSMMLLVSDPAAAQGTTPVADTISSDMTTPEGATAPDAEGLSVDAPAASDPPTSVDLEEPVTIIDNAMRSLPGFEDGVSGGLSVMILLTVITLAPSIVIMCTSFTRIVIVLSLLRQALGTQALPPSQVIVGLSLFLTLLVMQPTIQKINEDAITPLNNNEINDIEAWNRAAEHIKLFMLTQIDRNDNWNDVFMIENYKGTDTTNFDEIRPRDLEMTTVIPAFILSELKVAFMMGFRIYLPFLIIDMVIASVLISMGMLMLPPVLISLPFKLLLFVMVDGWRLVVGNLLMSFTREPPAHIVV